MAIVGFLINMAARYTCNISFPLSRCINEIRYCEFARRNCVAIFEPNRALDACGDLEPRACQAHCAPSAPSADDFDVFSRLAFVCWRTTLTRHLEVPPLSAAPCGAACARHRRRCRRSA